MKHTDIYIGNSKTNLDQNAVEGELVQIENESYYKISNSDAMRPFFMSIVSDSNHWMFIASNGGLTAGRKDAESSLFPYYTDDKITESAEITGSKTLMQVTKKEKTYLWEPFSNRYAGIYTTTRNLYKSVYGNKLVFEEINHDLKLRFTYEWNSSNEFGFVKKSTLKNEDQDATRITVLDGLQNILPYGVNSSLQNSSSNLVDAYKRAELEAEVGLGIYALSAFIVDKAEPSESLKANIVWSFGLENATYLLSSLQLDAFRKGRPIHPEKDIKAEKGAYFIQAEISLPSLSEKKWSTVANVNQNHSAIANIINTLKTDKNIAATVNQSINLGTDNLIQLAASSDGLQTTTDRFRNTRHFSNTLFNIMRGGIFDHNYRMEKWDFKNYLAKSNKKSFQSAKPLIERLPDEFTSARLKEIGQNSEDKDFERLCLEYMPLKFSRRHGDPSRPWNKFSINTRSETDGSKILDYEGNWRDIFQNWEALAHSFPDFTENMIHKFLNASTFDGYNPYRVTKDGFDWETIEPDDPWSYIGYWGDHQIIYLLKFLEIIENHHPGKLISYFDKDLFVYANVPYKIKSYTDILKNPKDTIEFDLELDHEIGKRKLALGADGALLFDQQKEIYKVNFIEKILATVLAKTSNFIPEAGIWLNTQRPEWNDANNALVGNGVSMVTLYYLRRFLSFFDDLISNVELAEISISEELLLFFNQVHDTLDQNESLLIKKINDTDRKRILDGLGMAGSDYRAVIYKNGFSGKKARLSLASLSGFVKTTLKGIDHTIDVNRRSDNLYHAYNLMTIADENKISISYLSEMLEGQVAVLSSGYLSSEACLKLLDGLKHSQLFREDQYSYLLYPNKELSRFLIKNTLPKNAIAQSELLQQMIADGHTSIVEKDVYGNTHFNGNFHNAGSIKEALKALKGSRYETLAEKDEDLLLQTFEQVFNHKAFTGRSGTFYGYEGLGSIYWHMVSKLLLAVQECCLKAIATNESDEITGRLLEHYYEINEGIGVHKSPELYGAFPTDAYSHTPAGKGAQQPGMTGQVKEDILSRFGELGVFVTKGQLYFNPCMLRKVEFLKEPKTFNYLTVSNVKSQLQLRKGELAMTYCQVPIVYKISTETNIEITLSDGQIKRVSGLSLDKSISKMVFQRSGEIEVIRVQLKEDSLK
ncbi:hypothetical protein [Cellulophaga sp. Hel_I_12]|uniref:hypothetical protein n=1 Tax=Cellulophaga sp. Hel_I_12 TaxID=1249972 RepID=UPI0006482AC4|nr:hypothetical protein [Cellulophaga sp. Hel_I_12]